MATDHPQPPNGNDDYDSSSIKVLKGLDAVRILELRETEQEFARDYAQLQQILLG